VALGEDTMFTYGAVTWGFGVHAGHVVDEHLSVRAGQSATFDAAMERHRDFYVHEPVTFYFEFDDAGLSALEAAKIDSFLPYLTRNSDVELSLEGFADIAGGASDYNRDLSMRRVEAVEAGLLAKGIAGSRIAGITIGHGASASATPDAGTGDQGGSAAVAADQSREANRWANRRVVLTFSHVAAPAPVAGP
jgi:outer membrane protein OmpA-like peptidoglycan-associated protein